MHCSVSRLPNQPQLIVVLPEMRHAPESEVPKTASKNESCDRVSELNDTKSIVVMDDMQSVEGLRLKKKIGSKEILAIGAPASMETAINKVKSKIATALKRKMTTKLMQKGTERRGRSFKD